MDEGASLHFIEGCSEAVKEVFVRLYDKGLIYRGNRMVNWCPHCNTSISDAEVEYEEKDGSFWHLLYPVKETGENSGVKWFTPEGAVEASSEPWFREHIYQKLNEKMQQFRRENERKGRSEE